MSGFSDPFGGGTLKAAEVSYRAVTLAANLLTNWPAFATSANVLARSMNVTPSLAGLTVFMPDARQATPGQQTTFYNSGSSSYAVAAADGTPIASIEPGGRRLVELIDNVSNGGAWIVTLLGVGVGSLDVAAATGAGLKAIGTTLNVAFQVETVAATRAITAADRDKVLVWTGGAGTLTFPASGAVPDFNCEIRNQGTGALTLAFTGGELIDGVASLIFNNAESAWIHADTGAWYTVGRGRNAQFNFTQLQKTVTGGTVALTLTEAANVVQTYTGTLLSNVDIVLPSVVQVYYVSNQTGGAFNMRFKNAAVGATISLPQGQNAVLFSDGVNVINASTTIAGIGAITFGPGTVASPSVQIGAVNTGFYAPSGGQVAFSSGGAQTFLLSATGALVTLAGSAINGVTSTGSSALFAASSPAGARAAMQTNTVNSPRWIFGKDSAAESGSNAGSNWTIERYNDAGVLIDSPVSINRATGAVIVATSVRDLGSLGEIVMFAGSEATTHANCLKANGALVSRATYADLWAYAQTTTPVSEATWSANNQGRFSVGDGSTTFRIPDLRAAFLRGLDESRGWDPARTWGSFQDHINVVHNHAMNDAGHVHGVSDPTHAHSISDPSHQHGGSTDVQGNHAHSYTAAVNTGNFAQNAFNWAVYGATGAATSTDGAHAHNFATDYRGTGIGIYGNGTGISIQLSGTGVSTQNNGGADGHPRNFAYPYFIRY